MQALKMFRKLAPFTLAALLAACASDPAREVAAPVAGAPATPPPAAEPQPVPERPFPADSVYPLLVAEFALRQREFDLALANYLALAERLRDPGISAHTTHLAQFLKREPQALAAVRLWVELEPDNPEANNTLATLLVRQARPVAAVPHLAVVARHGLDAHFPMLLGGFRELPPDQQLALGEAVEALSSEFPEHTRLWLTLALIHDEMGQNGPAQAALERVFELEPWQQQALMLEARLLLEDDDPVPFQRIEKALKTDPDDAQLRLQYARLLTRTDMKAARKQFEILSAQAPRDGDLLLSLALLNQDTGDTIAAKAYLQQLLALGQRSDEAHYYLGRIAEQEGRPREAIASYLEVADPEGQEFFNARGRVGRMLLESGDSDGSARYFSRQREDYPQVREQLYTLESELLNRAGLLDDSMALLNRALEELPQSTSLRYSRSMLGEQRNDLDLMEQDLRTILEQEPNNATALNALGYTLSNRTDRYEEAYELISRALELAPEEPAILDSMGWVLYRKGQAEEAVEYLQRAYLKFPDPEVAAHLGEVLWSLGKTGEARDVWQGGLRENPQHKVLLETLQRLDVPISDLKP